MRPLYLLLSLFCVLALVACGTEEEITPPTFSNIMVNGAVVSSVPYKDPNVTITGNIDDFTATIVANSTVTGEHSVVVDRSDGSWSFDFAPLAAGTNSISFIATDDRGNFNQMTLTILHDPTPPSVISVTQSVADPVNPLLVVSFDEVLLEASLTTATFSVTTVDNTPVTGALTGTLAQSTVTLALPASLSPGVYRLVYSDIADLAGNIVSAANFDFTIE